MRACKILPSCAAMVAFCVASAHAAPRPHMLVISIDGMRPDYVTHADEHGLKIPTLRRFLVDGAYAEGVRGVTPTYTYPSHTTLITGVAPAQHGVYNNQKFDPLGTLHGAVYTEASAIKVETLWHAAHDAGYTTASVGWPVTTGSADIDYLMPANARFEGKAADSEQVGPVPPGVHFDHPAGLRETLAADLPPRKDLSIDQTRFAWTKAILQRYKPEFMTTHLGELDHAEHLSGPFSRQSDQALEALDGEVAQLVALELAVDPKAYIVVVSDHGFEPVETTVNLGVIFAQAGLLHPASANDPGTWQAAPWPSGGTAAVMLRDPLDQAVAAKVNALLKKLASAPEYGMARVFNRDEMKKWGGYPDASFLVELKPGYKFGTGYEGPVVTRTPHTGAHGFLPDRPELFASFLMEGPSIQKGRDLGIVDMRQIAPTLARILHVALPLAQAAPLRVF